MTISSRLRMIPRYKWEYGASDLCRATAAAIRPPPAGGRTIEALFGRQALFTSSGRASLYAILRSLNLPEGAGIGVPLFCCSVVFDAVRQAGMRPVFLDIMGDTFTVSPSDIDKKRNTISAVIAVHMFGHPADMDAVKASTVGLPVIEDCAHGLFSTYRDQYVGIFGKASFFSFRSGKYLSSGEGSAIFCNDPSLYGLLTTAIAGFEEWRLPGMLLHCIATYVKTAFYQRPLYGLVGYPLGKMIDVKLNLTAKKGFFTKKIASCDLHIIDRRLPSFNEKIERQRRNARYYQRFITNRDVILPFDQPLCRSNYYQFALRLPSKEKRNRMAGYLKTRGVDTGQYLDDVASLARELYGYSGDCPISEQCSQTVLTIPNYYSLSERDVAYIADAVNECPI